MDGIYELFETCINLIKSNDYTMAKVRDLAAASPQAIEMELLLILLWPIYDAYCEYLSSRGQIDFNDMINLAAKYVLQRRYDSPIAASSLTSIRTSPNPGTGCWQP